MLGFVTQLPIIFDRDTEGQRLVKEEYEKIP